MKKLIIAVFLFVLLFGNIHGQELIEKSKQVIEYEMADEEYDALSGYALISTSPEFMGAISSAVMNFNTGAVPPNNFSILDAEIKRIETLMNSLQTGNYSSYDLQNLLNQQKLNAEKLLQILSNISKMLHETANSIIRRMG